MPLQVRTVVSMPFEENTYIVFREDRDDALVIDPGLEPEAILECLEKLERTPAAILNTHGHADHIAGNQMMKERFPDAPLIIGRLETNMLSDPHANLSAPFGFWLTSPPADRTVEEGDRLDLAGIELEVLFVPGHSPGHVAFLCRGEPCHVFAGDVLFRDSVGRMDFPGGSGATLMESIRTKLYTLPDDTVVYPGHGPTTTTGREKLSNPYVRL